MTSDQEQDRQVEHMVLLEIVALHPECLTPDELAARLEGQPDRLAILDAIDALKRCGLVRLNGGIVEPTHPAMCMAMILELRSTDNRVEL